MRIFILVVVVVLVAAAASGCTRRITRTDLGWSQLVDEHRHDTNIEGLSMHYIDLGAGDPVVLIHGIGDSTYSWHLNAQALVDAGFRVILIDQPGFGHSAIPTKSWKYSVENQADAILQVVNRLGIDRFQLVGHSLGGGESLYLAEKHGDRISRVALLSPVSQRTSCPFGFTTELVADVFGTRWLTSRALRSAYYRSEKVDDVTVDEYARLIDRPGRAGVLGGVCKSYFSPEYDRMVESYPHLKPELLVVWGAQDTWHPLAFGTRLQSLVPRSRLEVIPEAGHNVHQERPDAVNPLLIGFLSGQR